MSVEFASRLTSENYVFQHIKEYILLTEEVCLVLDQEVDRCPSLVYVYMLIL